MKPGYVVHLGLAECCYPRSAVTHLTAFLFLFRPAEPGRALLGVLAARTLIVALKSASL